MSVPIGARRLRQSVRQHTGRDEVVNTNTQPAQKRLAADGVPFLWPCRLCVGHAWLAPRSNDRPAPSPAPHAGRRSRRVPPPEYAVFPLERKNHRMLPPPQLKFGFCKYWRTASCEMDAKWCHSTILSASKCKVQRLCPAGGGEQATAISWLQYSHQILVAGPNPFLTGQRGFQALVDPGLSGACNGCTTHVKGLLNLCICPRRSLWTLVSL